MDASVADMLVKYASKVWIMIGKLKMQILSCKIFQDHTDGWVLDCHYSIASVLHGVTAILHWAINTILSDIKTPSVVFENPTKMRVILVVEIWNKMTYLIIRNFSTGHWAWLEMHITSICMSLTHFIYVDKKFCLP